MVVTTSLARGALQEAVRLHSAKVEAMWEALTRTPMRVPATYRRFDEWFRTHRRIHEQAALLIVFGKIGRRRGALSAFTPQFQEVGTGWELEIRQLSVKFSPGCLEQISLERLPVTISGHALERMFQRTDSIRWPVVRDCLAGATLFLNAAITAYVAAGCKQCVIPADKGVLVGHVVEGELALRTFVPEQAIQPKWQSLLSDLKKFIVQHKLEIETSALTQDDEPAIALKALLTSGKHKWLFEPYVPGVDLMEGAWRNIETAADAQFSATTKSVD